MVKVPCVSQDACTVFEGNSDSVQLSSIYNQTLLEHLIRTHLIREVPVHEHRYFSIGTLDLAAYRGSQSVKRLYYLLWCTYVAANALFIIE